MKTFADFEGMKWKDVPSYLKENIDTNLFSDGFNGDVALIKEGPCTYLLEPELEIDANIFIEGEKPRLYINPDSKIRYCE